MYELLKNKHLGRYHNRIPKIIGVITFLVLPFLYGYKMETGMEKVDLYFFWIFGFLAWFQFRIDTLDRIDLLIGVLSLLAAITTISHETADVNSFKILITLFFSFSIYSNIRSHQSVSDNISWIVIPSLLCQVSFGYWQFFHFSSEPLMIKGSFFNSGYFGNWLAPCAVLLLARLSKYSDRRQKKSILIRVGLYVLFFATVFLLFKTQARAALFGCLAGSIFILWMYCRANYQKQWRVGFIVIAFFSVITACVWFFMIKQHSAMGRLTIYEVSWRMIRDNWLFGVGSNRFQAHYNFYQGQYFQTTVSQIKVQQLAGNTFEAFNFILQWWAEYGVISILGGGLVFYFFIKKRIKVLLLKKKMEEQHGYIAALICLLCSGLFSNPFHCSVTFLLFISLFASIGRHNSVTHTQVKLASVRFPTIVIKIPLIILSIYFLYFGFNQWRAEIQWKQASSLALFESFEKAKPLYEEAYKNLKTDGRFLYNYGAELSQVNEYKHSISLLEQASHYYASSNLNMYLGLDYSYTGDYKSAERNFLYAIHTVPSAILPKYQLIQLYLKINRKVDAAAWIRYTLNYPIKIRDEVSDKILEELKVLEEIQKNSRAN